MRKEDIVRRIAEETAYTQAQADEAVEAILATLKQTLQQGDAVILRRFGTFRVEPSGRASAATPGAEPLPRLRPGGSCASRPARR